MVHLPLDINPSKTPDHDLVIGLSPSPRSRLVCRIAIEESLFRRHDNLIYFIGCRQCITSAEEYRFWNTMAPRTSRRWIGTKIGSLSCGTISRNMNSLGTAKNGQATSIVTISALCLRNTVSRMKYILIWALLFGFINFRFFFFRPYPESVDSKNLPSDFS